MLSYQHGYHAGNLADVHKHATLASAIHLLTRKEKPLSYIETHSGRGLYDLTSEFALKTGEAEAGILTVDSRGWFEALHPYTVARRAVQAAHGESAYPGSPLIAQMLLRSEDRMHLAELHPTEHEALRRCMDRSARVYREDGFKLANRLCPPTPRRGLILVDPSYERADEYQHIPEFLAHITGKWNVCVAVLWYPLLHSRAHQPMIRQLERQFPEGVRHEVSFPAVREGHGLVGSGLFLIRMPFGLERDLDHLSQRFKEL